jgi:hypothetical protein
MIVPEFLSPGDKVGIVATAKNEFRELFLRHLTVMESKLPNGVRIPQLR